MRSRKKGATMKKLLIILGILGIIVAIFLAMKNRQDTYEFDT
jgi:preprotein translocase subunit SecG